MKKIIYLTVVTLLLTACGIYKTLDLRKLTTGMTKAQVERIAGAPSRILSIRETEDGYQEVLEYRTANNEIYALEFWDDYLTGYEYLYDDVTYVAPMYPPYYYPPYGRPIIIIPGDNRPNRPGQSSRPPIRPNQPGRPNRPSESVRPGESSRPGSSRPESSRPSESSRPPAQRPTTRPAESSRPVGTPSQSTSTSRDRERTESTQTVTNRSSREN